MDDIRIIFMKEKLEYLEHEDVETMEKKTAELRKKETEEERKKIASLKIKEKEVSLEKEITPEIPQIAAKEKIETAPTLKGLPIFQKILIRIFYLFLFTAMAGFIYWLFVK